MKAETIRRSTIRHQILEVRYMPLVATRRADAAIFKRRRPVAQVAHAWSTTPKVT